MGVGGADGKKVRWGIVTAPESDSSALFCLSLLPCLLIPFLTLSPPPHPPPPSRSLAHAIARSLFPQSDQGERSAWVASPSLLFLFRSSAILLHPLHLHLLSFCSWKPVRKNKNPPALHQRQDTGEGKTSGGNRLVIPHRIEESLFFSSFWWLTCSADSPLKGNT